MNQTRGRTKSDSATLDFTPDNINENFANICHTDNYVEPENTESHNGAYSALTLHKNHHNLRKIKKTAVGFDDIPAWVLSENAHNLAPSIQHIYNLSLRDGVFPKAFKILKIVPPAKVPEPDGVDQLRPISITPVLSRHFERLVYTKFIKTTTKFH